MTAEIITLRNVTLLDIPTERVLNGALEADLERCFVVGRQKDGTFYFASTFSDGGTVMWDMEIAKQLLLAVEIGQ